VTTTAFVTIYNLKLHATPSSYLCFSPSCVSCHLSSSSSSSSPLALSLTLLHPHNHFTGAISSSSATRLRAPFSQCCSDCCHTRPLSRGGRVTMWYLLDWEGFLSLFAASRASVALISGNGSILKCQRGGGRTQSIIRKDAPTRMLSFTEAYKNTLKYLMSKGIKIDTHTHTHTHA